MKTQEKATLTVEKTSPPKSIIDKNEKRSKMVDLLTQKIDKLTKNLESKKYIVDGDTKTGNALLDFLKNDAVWKFAEAKGVIEAYKQIETAFNDIKSKKVKHLLVDSTALEAIYYFLSKTENKGLESAKFYIDNLLSPISNALSSVKEDRSNLDQMVRDRATLESAIDSGADLENEDSILKEIENELSKEI